MVAKKPAPKKPARKMTVAQDHRFDKKYGIKDGSPLDTLLDNKVIKKPVKKVRKK